MSNTIRFYFEIDKEADAEEMRKLIEAELLDCEGVDKSEVVIPKQRLVGVDDIVLTIGAAVLIAKSAKEGVEALSELLKSLTKLIENCKALKSAIVETPDGAKPLEDISKDEIGKLISN